MLGVARRAVDTVRELALNKTPVTSSGLLKERSSAQVQLGKAEAVLRSGRLLLLDTVNEAWQDAWRVSPTLSSRRRTFCSREATR